jgi:uncharacterized membrane protein YqjE
VIATDPTREASSLTGRARALFESVGAMLGERAHLLTLELRLAGRAIGLIVVLLVGAAVTALTAWTAFWVGVAAALHAADWRWEAIAAFIVLVNLVAAALCLWQIRRVARLLTLPATLRQLKKLPAGEARAAAAAASSP